ncbi:acetylcholine receptor subunit alpha-like 1 isoform X2 [Cimex lectularius]|uniref:Uncharacterized protein n=1 Tax=Cimex lectularius TaxID=79782 RepID=A0A8I6RPI3_CIMLE|nr:acetylcholine receptor subunit alpha-like 1 isoform X2 [Cimex lectularius]
MSMYAVSLFLLGVFGFSAYGQPDKGQNGKGPIWNATMTDLLKRDLFQGYDKFARPAQHSDTTNVDLAITVRYVHVDDKRFMLTVHGWLKMVWHDEKLKWNETEYKGLTMLYLADHELWQPDITLFNSAVGNTLDHYGNSHSIAYCSGTVLWVPPAQFIVYCNLDLTHWPFDTQMCHLILGSWTSSGDQINLTAIEETVNGDTLGVDGSEWKLLKVETKRKVTFYACCDEPYIQVYIYLTVSRLSATYYSAIVLPTIGMVLMTLSLFWLSPHTQERMVLSATILLLICIYLVYFSQRLPATGSNTPLIVSFYSYHLILVVLAIIMSVVTYNLASLKKPVPWYIQNIVRGPLGYILGVHHQQVGYTVEMSGEDEIRSYDDTREERGMLPTNQPGKPWAAIAAALDRFLFFFYVLVFFCLALRSAF